MLQLNLFGQPEIILNDEPVTAFESAKVQALLHYLAVTGRTHSREILATLLWGELPDATAKRNLTKALTNLRQLLEPYILIERYSVGFNQEMPCVLDVTIFRAAVEGSLMLEPKHPERDLFPLRQAVSLYQGDFLEGFHVKKALEFEEWLLGQREQLRKLMLQALQMLTEHYARSGADLPTAMGYAHRWLTLEPWQETAHRHLMLLLARSGQRSAALAQYETCCQLLADELGVEPMPEMTALYEQIRDGLLDQTVFMMPVPLPPPAFLSTSPAQNAPTTPFVARQQELAQLQAHLDQALTGNSRLAFITGEAGRGKTSLMAEFARQAQRSWPDLIVATGVCSVHGDIGDPYLPFRDILAQLTGELEARLATGALLLEQARRLWAFLPQTLQALFEHGPNLLNILAPGPALIKRLAPYAADQPQWFVQVQNIIGQQQARQGQLGQSQLFEQMTQVLQALAAQRPLLLLLDDLQWIDTASLNLLFHLGRRLEGSRILLLGAYRASEVNVAHPLEPVITEFKRRFGEIQLDLERADPSASRNFVDALLDTEPNRFDETFRENLFRHTKGYPLFTIELLRHLQERGYLIRDDSGRWFENEAFESGNLPARIEAVIHQRLNRLDPVLLDLLRTAAVEGEIFSAQIAAHVQRLDERLILQRLSILEQEHWLVREHSEVQLDQQYLNRYQFSHALFQHFLYQQLSQGERRLLHRAVAEALSIFYQPQVAEIAVQLAHHYTQAGAKTQAAAYHLTAGDRAMKGAALEEAVHSYQAALAGWPAKDEAGQAEILRKLGECLWMMGQTAAALEVFERCYDLFEILGNRLGAGAVQRLIGRIHWSQGQRAISLDHYHQALSILEDEPPSIELAEAISSISQMHMLASEYEQAIAWGERALTLAKKLDAKEVVVHASINIGVSLTSSATSNHGLDLLRESLQQALTLNMPQEACRAYANLGEALIKHSRYAEAEAIVVKLLAYTTQVGAVLFQGGALVSWAELDWWQGRWATAMSHCRQIKVWREEFHGAIVPKVWASTLIGGIYNDPGQPQLARQELEGQLRTARTFDETQTTVPHLGQLARSMAALGLEQEMMVLIQEVLTLLKRTPAAHAHSISPLLFACHWLGQQPANPESLEIARKCLRQLERIEAQYQSQESTAALAEARGSESLRRDQADSAVRQFRQAATQWGDLNRPYDQARALNQLGQALRRTDDPCQAQSTFGQALDTIETLAGQLEDVELRASFLNSPLVEEIRAGQARR